MAESEGESVMALGVVCCNISVRSIAREAPELAQLGESQCQCPVSAMVFSRIKVADGSLFKYQLVFSCFLVIISPFF